MATESHHGSVCPGYTRCSLQLEKSSVFGVNPCKTQLKIGRQHSSKLYTAAQSTLSASEMFSVVPLVTCAVPSLIYMAVRFEVSWGGEAWPSPVLQSSFGSSDIIPPTLSCLTQHPILQSHS